MIFDPSLISFDMNETVVEGMDIVKKIEGEGSQTGRTKSKIEIASSGTL